MKNAKKLLSILILGTVICTSAYNVYQTSYAAEAVVAGGLASAGVALVGLCAIAGVGMELDNNRRFNELSDEEKQRIENGLATNFEDVALQRGASIEHIKEWTTDLCNGVLDKASECWGIFKDWVKNISLTYNESGGVVENGRIVSVNELFGVTFTNRYGVSVNLSDYSSVIREAFGDSPFIGFLISQPVNDSQLFRIYGIVDNSNTIIDNTNIIDGYAIGNGWYEYYGQGHFSVSSNTIYLNASKPCIQNGENVNGIGVNDVPIEYFSTNTDYLEKLKGQDEDVIDVIDVTDIKNPIIETRPNSLANINWNRGTRRTNNNKDDDDNKMVTGLVPMDVWYEQIDDEQKQMQNAVVVYDNYIQEHPEEKDTYFISTTPVTNINNYFNTLPVVNIPAQGTVVNNNYEYNNYNNNNVTIYQEPYSAGIIPTFPDFSKKFPFCIPFDLYEFFVVFLAEKEAPKIEVPFPVLDNTNHQLNVEHITIDLSGYEYLSDVLRVMLFVLFCVGLMILTRQLIKG